MSTSRRVSRRGFMCAGLGTVSAGLALPVVISRQALSAAGLPGAGDRIGIGYIGVGRRASGLMGLPRAVQITGACDVDMGKAQAVAKSRKCKAYRDYRAMLEAADVDAVIIATPDHWHALPSIHACQAGKDVYCEKPMTLTVREGRAMVEAVRKYQCVFQTGSQQRSMAQNRLGCELVRNGRIGKVHTIIGHNYPSPWECALPAQPVPEGLDWDLWCGPVAPMAYHQDVYTARANPGWISFRPFSGGEVTGWGAHGLDQVQWALGMDESGPVEVWTEGGAFEPPTYRTPESRARGEKACSRPKVCCRYANGAVLKLENGPAGGAVFIGDKGRITIDRARCVAEPADLAAEPFGDGDVRLQVSNDHMLNWIECIKARKTPVADVEVGHRSTTVCHLVNIARWVGRRLTWDPVKEIFPGDDEANGHLVRPMRAPYGIPERI